MAMQDAARAAFSSALASHGKDATYRRGSDAVSIRALEGKTDRTMQGQYGALVVDRVKDWVVRADMLVLDGKQIEPEPGDDVEVEEGDTTWRYEVMELETGQCWRFSGPGRDRYRIHTRFIGEA